MVMGVVFLVVSARVAGRGIDAYSQRKAERRDHAADKDVEGLRKLLLERIENLETIVCGVDFELNQKLHKVLDEQRLLATGAAPVAALTAGAAASPPAAAGATASPAALAAAPAVTPQV